MTAIHKIREYLSNFPEGKPFTASILREFASTENIRQVLNRLVKARELQRVARGIFVKPKHLLSLKEQLPSTLEIAEALAQSTGETILIHGAEAARQLQLTTQVPMRLVFYTNGNTRTLKLGTRTIKLIHINPSRLIAPGTTFGLVISALRYLGHEQVTIETLHVIQQRISSQDFEKLFELTERLPAWMSDLFYQYQQKRKE